MTESQAQALLRQFAHLNTREAANSQRLDALDQLVRQLIEEMQAMRALLVCDYHSREAHVMA